MLDYHQLYSMQIALAPNQITAESTLQEAHSMLSGSLRKPRDIKHNNRLSFQVLEELVTTLLNLTNQILLNPQEIGEELQASCDRINQQLAQSGNNLSSRNCLQVLSNLTSIFEMRNELELYINVYTYLYYYTIRLREYKHMLRNILMILNNDDLIIYRKHIAFSCHYFYDPFQELTDETRALLEQMKYYCAPFIASVEQLKAIIAELEEYIFNDMFSGFTTTKE